MRKLLALLVLVALFVPLAGCSSACDGTKSFLKIQSPIDVGSEPVIRPSGYAVYQPAAPRMVAVPQYQLQYAPAAAAPCAPAAYAPAACAPQYAPQVQYAAPQYAVPYSTPYNWAPAPTYSAPAAGCR